MEPASPALPDDPGGRPGGPFAHIEAISSSPTAVNALGTVLEEFGASHQIEVTGSCVIAVRRPTPTVQEITASRTPEELLIKLRAERDGAS